VRRNDGFTLIEVIVTMAIMLIVFGATVTALGAFTNENHITTLRAEMQERARNTLDRIAHGLRDVTAPNSKAPGALDRAEPYSITFDTLDTSNQEFEKNVVHAMRVRYCLSDVKPENETLYQQVQRWKTAEPPAVPTATECPDVTPGDWAESSKMATNIVNRVGGQSRPVFIYSATETPQIVTVETNLYLDLNPNVAPRETQLTTAVSLRNANRPPIVSFTATPINEHVLLNGSESRDPEGLSLTYKWFQNGTQLPTTSETYETEKLPKGTYTFKLEVTDPGGLTSSETRTVTF
jgi:prepilin-type N-terminal cleavage/methylation domain-containing protein